MALLFLIHSFFVFESVISDENSLCGSPTVDLKLIFASSNLFIVLCTKIMSKGLFTKDVLT